MSDFLSPNSKRERKGKGMEAKEQEDKGIKKGRESCYEIKYERRII